MSGLIDGGGMGCAGAPCGGRRLGILWHLEVVAHVVAGAVEGHGRVLEPVVEGAKFVPSSVTR